MLVEIYSIPSDKDGIVSITVPVGIKPLEKASEGSKIKFFYYTSPDYENYYLGSKEDKVELLEVSDDPRNNENVRYYQTENGEIATDYIGVQANYARFLAAVDDVKAKIASGKDTTYSTTLNVANGDVADVYWIPAGYELYSENKDDYSGAKLLYVVDADGCEEDGRKIYYIPADNVNKFTVVTTGAYNLLTTGDAFKAQLADMYTIYSQSAGNMGYTDEAQANRGR